MGYSLILIHAGDDAEAAVEAYRTSESREINPGPPSDEAEARKAELVQALRAIEPELVPFEFQFSLIAESKGISEAEARVRYRHIELNGPSDSGGLQITLFDTSAAISLPYWHDPDEARDRFGLIWSCVEAFTTRGFVLFDPQLGSILDPSVDRQRVLSSFGFGKTKTDEIEAQARKPWWRFW